MIDLAAELSARHGLRFEDYTSAIRNLTSLPDFPPDLVRQLEPLPGFRNVLVHEYVDLDRAVLALDHLAPFESFAEIVRRLEARSS